jgi:membrane protease YdiL (CAAX protease family)
MNNNSRQSLASGCHLAGFFLISAGLVIASWLLSLHPFSPDQGHRFLLYLGLIAMELLLVWFVIAGARANGNGLMDMVGRGWRNWRDCARDCLLALGTLVLVAVSARMVVLLLGRWSPRVAFLLPTTLAESIGWSVVAITAGICEEIVYRGYLQRQLSAFTGSLPIAVCLQAVIFGAAHLYQGWKPGVAIVVVGFILGSVAAWRRSIIPGIIAHAILDILSSFTPH